MAIRIFVTKSFDRKAGKVGLSDHLLVEAAMRAERGLVDAHLGRYLIKQRVARVGQGRSRGFRTIIVYRKGDLAVFIFAFAKSDQSNLTDNELMSLQALADSFIEASPSKIVDLVAIGEWRPIHVVH